MRSLSLIAVLLFVACGEEEPPRLVADFANRSEAVACEPLPGPEPGPASVTQLRPVSDSTFLLVDGTGREVAVLDQEARRLRTLEFLEDGPRGIAELSDAALSGDTLLVLADGGRHRLRAFDAQGHDLWTLDLSFPPQGVAFAGSRLLIAAAGMDPRLTSLVYEVRDRVAESVGVPFATSVDALGRMFVNFVTLQGYPDGSAVVAHQFVQPRAWRLAMGTEPSLLRLPVPEAVAPSLGYLPPIPFREDDLERIAAPVIASAPDPETGDLLYLTRSGRQRGEYTEKALVRADHALRYVGSRLLDVNAVALAYLPADPTTAVVVDYDQNWFRCEAP